MRGRAALQPGLRVGSNGARATMGAAKEDLVGFRYDPTASTFRADPYAV
jgi:hypothetical protein